MNPENAIEVHNVEKTFRVHMEASHQLKDAVIFHNRNKVQERKVLRGISFNVKKGQAVALIGKNGCGKSTTLKLLTKILRPDKGNIEMRGRVSSLIELGAGFHPDMTGRENVYINASIFGIKRKEVDRRMEEIIRFSELENFIDNPVRTYSSGMYMRLAFAVAINVDADILLIDEILAVGDAAFQGKCFDKMRSLRKKGVTIVLVSHSMGQVESICDKAIWIADGLIREIGDTAPICAHYLDDVDERRIARDNFEKAQVAGKSEKTPLELLKESMCSADKCREINDKCEIETRRSGKMGVSFTRIDALDETGKNTQQFETGKELRLNLHFAVNPKVVALSKEKSIGDADAVEFSISDDNGLSYFSTRKSLGCKMRPTGESTINCRIEQLPLLARRYFLNFRLIANDGSSQDHLKKFIEIEVRSPFSAEHGLITMPHQWDSDSTQVAPSNRHKPYDYLIVGAGLYGAAFARQARDAGKKCLVIDKRDHIAGNIFTEKVEGIDVHRYGAHIFHTNNKDIWNYVKRFSDFNRYTNCPVANYKGELYDLPFNMNTFNKMWGVQTPEEARAKIAAQRAAAGITEPKNLEEQAISLVGTDIYEKLIKGYTQKQWGRPCTELPAFIIQRLPVRLTFDNNYFNALYQGIPVNGYTEMVREMLSGTEVRLGVDYLADRDALNTLADTIVYTGPVDEYFKYRLGALEYRSVRFETETLDQENFQGNAVINYTDAKTPYTRIIEHKHFTYGTQPKTVISREYSAEWKPGDEPYYPVNDKTNDKLYEKYKKMAELQNGVIFGGRLGEYKYYDMDRVLEKALSMASLALG